MAHVTRRSFLRTSLLASTGTAFSGLAVGTLGFLWPRPGDELTGEHDLGDAADLAAEIVATRTPVRSPLGGISIVVWDTSAAKAAALYGERHAITGAGVGLMALNSRRCVHLGCAVPWCQSSQWFECPCHGSRYNRYGEWVTGPAPRGLDRYRSHTVDGRFVVNFSELDTGPARTAGSLEQPAEGPACVDV